MLATATCINSGKQCSHFCIYDTCDKLAYICDFCQDHSCKKVHIHHGQKSEMIEHSQMNSLIMRLLNEYPKQNMLQEFTKLLMQFIAGEKKLNGSQIRIFYKNIQNCLNIRSFQDKIKMMNMATKIQAIILAYEQLIFLSFKFKQYLLAQKYSQKILSLNSNYYNAYFYLEKIIKQCNKQQYAISKFTEGIRNTPSDKLLYYKRGRMYAVIGQHDKALQDFNKVVQLDHKFYLVYNSIGLIYYEKQQFKIAYNYYEKSLKLNLMFPNAYNNIGLIHYTQKAFSKAVNYYKRAIAYNKTYSTAYYNLGLIYHQMNQIQLAITYYQKSIQVDKMHQHTANAFNNLAGIYDDIDQYQKSIYYYDEAIKHNPKQMKFYINKGQLYQKLHIYEQALFEFNKCLELFSPNTHNSQPYLKRGIVYFNMNQNEKAEEDLTKYIEIYPNYPESYYYLGRIYMSRKLLQKALDLFQKAISLIDYVVVEYYIYRAAISASLGFIDRAQRDQEKILSVNENQVENLKKLYRLGRSLEYYRLKCQNKQ